MIKNIMMSIAVIALCTSCASAQNNGASTPSVSQFADARAVNSDDHEAKNHQDDNSSHHKPNHDEPRPYDKTRDAMADVDATLVKALASGKMSLLVLGANWCHDSRGLAARFEKEEFISLIDNNYELLYVDVGKRDRNLDVAKRFGIHEIIGTPTVLVLDKNGELLNADTASDWRRAASISDDETYTYFSSFMDGQE